MNEIEKEFEELDRIDDWEDAFRNINSINTDSQVKLTYTHAKHSSNERYNRYRNILPYDHSRIKLKEISDTDYINANLVENSLINRKYILTQGPLKNTCEHFWQMVWEQNTKGIIMLNKIYEKGFLKCEMYFPNVDEENGEANLKFGKFNLNYIKEKLFEDFSIRTIEVENLEQKETREVYHFHFTNWPDFGEPESTESFLNFLKECQLMNIFDVNEYGPPIVHCSAGVGRSGTFILVDSMIELFRLHGDNLPVRVSNLLAEFRTYRMGLVQTHQQFKFAFQAIVDFIRRDRQSKSDDLVKKITPSSDKSSESDEVDLEDSDDDDDDEDECEDDSFDSDDDDDLKAAEKTSRRRPGTAAVGNKKNTKRFKMCDEDKNRIKNLRLLQQKNKLLATGDATQQISDDQLIDISTAKPTRYSNGETNSNNNDKNNHDLNSSTDYDEDDDDETTPFAKTNRNIQTVRVNQPRALLNSSSTAANAQENNEPSRSVDSSEEEEQQQKQLDTINSSNFTLDNINGNFHNIIYQRTVQTSSNETNNFPSNTSAATTTAAMNSSAQLRYKSEKDQKLAEKLTQIKQNMLKHEQHKRLISQLKPFLIGGSILLGGFIIYQLYKKIF